MKPKVKSRTAFFFQREVILSVLLMISILMSALILIYFKYEQRVLFARMQKLQAQEDHYYIEKGKLLLEQSTWATPARLEKIAHEKLQMKLLKPKDYVLIHRDKSED